MLFLDCITVFAYKRRECKLNIPIDHAGLKHVYCIWRDKFTHYGKVMLLRESEGNFMLTQTLMIPINNSMFPFI